MLHTAPANILKLEFLQAIANPLLFLAGTVPYGIIAKSVYSTVAGCETKFSLLLLPCCNCYSINCSMLERGRKTKEQRQSVPFPSSSG